MGRFMQSGISSRPRPMRRGYPLIESIVVVGDQLYPGVGAPMNDKKQAGNCSEGVSIR